MLLENIWKDEFKLIILVFFVDSLYPEHDKSSFNAPKLESDNSFLIIWKLLRRRHLSLDFFENSKVNGFSCNLFGVCYDKGGGK